MSDVPDILRHLQGFLAGTPDYVSMLDRDGNLLYVNRTHPSLTPESIVGRSALEFLPENGKAPWQEAFDRALDTGEPQAFEVESAGGSAFRTRLVPLESDEGPRVLSLATDISESRRTERELDRSRHRLQVAIEAAEMGMFSWDAKTGVTTWDETMCRLMGTDSAPPGQEEFMEFVHPDDRARIARQIQSTFDTRVYEEMEHRVVHSDGEVRWVRARGKVMVDENDEVTEVLGVVFDNTETRELESQILQSQKLEALGQLTAGIAHNFNNLLGAIIPNLDLAATASDPSPYLADAREAGFRAADMVRQLLLFARKQPSKTTESVALQDVVGAVRALCDRAFPARIELRVEMEETPLEALVTQTSLEQALLNICLNARDAVADESEPRIEVRLDSLPGGMHRIRIRDNGPGIPAAVVERIYEPFFTTKVGEGTGLGLSTSFAIIEEHGGELSCESSPDGTEFTILLPALTSFKRQPRGESRTPAPPKAGASILVVEDDVLVRRSLVNSLEDAGRTIRTASNGQEALGMLDGVDLILLDVSMPTMGGHEFLAAMDDPILVVILTAGPLPEKADLPDNVHAVLSKPATMAALRAAVDEALAVG